jgi:hypothetical protein
MQTENVIEQTPARRASQPVIEEVRAPIKETKPARADEDRAAEQQDMYDNVACTD